MELGGGGQLKGLQSKNLLNFNNTQMKQLGILIAAFLICFGVEAQISGYTRSKGFVAQNSDSTLINAMVTYPNGMYGGVNGIRFISDGVDYNFSELVNGPGITGLTTPRIPYATSATAIANSNLYHGTNGLGIGAVPSGGSTNYWSWEPGKGLSIISHKTANDSHFIGNAYYNGTGYIYNTSSTANKLDFVTGGIVFETAASGTAGNTISAWNPRFAIDNAGILTINTTPPNDDTPSQVLSRNSGNGNIEYSTSTFALNDSELSAIAGLTSAANRLPYFTGSGTASLATFSSFARTLVDDAAAVNARSTLGLVIGTDVQAWSLELDALNSAGSGANQLPYYTSTGVATLTTLSSFGRSLIDDADASAARTTLGLTIGTNVQAYDAELAALASTTSAADALPYFTGSGTATTTTLSSLWRTIIDDTNASVSRSTLGIGSVGTQGDGDKGDVVVGSSGSSWTIDGATLTSGNYTPTATAIANVNGAIGVQECRYMRIFNVMHVSGTIEVNTTSTSPTTTSLRISLPFSTNFAALTDCSGTLSVTANSTSTVFIGTVYGDTVNDEAVINFKSGSSANDMTFEFTYDIQ
jgi:hypothetical protein